MWLASFIEKFFLEFGDSETGGDGLRVTLFPPHPQISCIHHSLFALVGWFWVNPSHQPLCPKLVRVWCRLVQIVLNSKQNFFFCTIYSNPWPKWGKKNFLEISTNFCDILTSRNLKSEFFWHFLLIKRVTIIGSPLVSTGSDSIKCQTKNFFFAQYTVTRGQHGNKFFFQKFA